MGQDDKSNTNRGEQRLTFELNNLKPWQRVEAPQHFKMTEDKFDIEAIRKEVAEFQKTLNWYDKRGGLLPYDWATYGHQHMMRLLNLCRIDFQGRLKKQDKRGAWR